MSRTLAATGGRWFCPGRVCQWSPEVFVDGEVVVDGDAQVGERAVLFAETLAQFFVGGFLRFHVFEGDAGAMLNGGDGGQGGTHAVQKLFIGQHG